MYKHFCLMETLEKNPHILDFVIKKNKKPKIDILQLDLDVINISVVSSYLVGGIGTTSASEMSANT